MGTHMNASLTPKSREMMVRAAPRGSSIRRQRPSPNGSSGSRPKAWKACATGLRGRFHRRAKRCRPPARRLRFCEGSVILAKDRRRDWRFRGDRQPHSQVPRPQPAFGPWSRPSRSVANEHSHPGELIRIDIKTLGRIGSIGHRISDGGRARSIAISALAGSLCTSASTMRPASPSAKS